METGLENCYVMKNNRRLRCGYTTGSCAAAAAKAAALMLFSHRPVHIVSLMTPKGIELHLEILDICMKEGEVSCAVRKDGGDDPDATHGVLVYARVSLGDRPGISIDGGPGVGRVTKKGLLEPVGAAAINPVPRRMIREAIESVCADFEYGGGILAEISIPEGIAIAQKTFNPRLGICGGISILGTSGIVKPMSEEALVETIRLDVRVRVAAGKRYLAVVPGNYGTAFLWENAGLTEEELIRCGNFFGDTVRILGEETIEGALVAGHIGKLVKVAGGVLNTHSRFGDRRMEILAGLAGEAGADERLRRLLLAQNTAEEAAETLQKAGALDGTAALLAERAAQALRAAGKIPVEVMVFSSRLGLLAETPGAREMMRRL